ncbi:hypothetical protein LTR05_000045 [Lithohypha guttulata]|uniref:Uncharacterized protein n=1 Tax=Lithohypha guttulata TaxID=1690604 RepID=A0AAN7T3V4_9EURO|nr:hypothetical protein LTR05_000045 [Lithohypha guttulata]
MQAVQLSLPKDAISGNHFNVYDGVGGNNLGPGSQYFNTDAGVVIHYNGTGNPTFNIYLRASSLAGKSSLLRPTKSAQDLKDGQQTQLIAEVHRSPSFQDKLRRSQPATRPEGRAPSLPPRRHNSRPGLIGSYSNESVPEIPAASSADHPEPDIALLPQALISVESDLASNNKLIELSQVSEDTPSLASTRSASPSPTRKDDDQSNGRGEVQIGDWSLSTAIPHRKRDLFRASSAVALFSIMSHIGIVGTISYPDTRSTAATPA